MRKHFKCIGYSLLGYDPSGKNMNCRGFCYWWLKNNFNSSGVQQAWDALANECDTDVRMMRKAASEPEKFLNDLQK